VRRRREMARMVDAAICVSEEMEEYARVSLGIKNTLVIPNGSDTELFTPEKRDAALYKTTKYKVLWSGSPKYQWQGLRTVQELSGKLKEKRIDDIMLVVTADGVSSDNLLYLGHVPYSQMPRYMASADAGLCIYEPIGFFKHFYFSPLKLYDYMSSGIPVIGTNEGQIRLVIQEHRNGLLTDNTLEDLIEKTLYLKGNPAAVSEMGLRGRKAVLEKHNWENIAAQTEAVCTDLLGKYAAVPARSSRGTGRTSHSAYGKVVMYLQLYHSVLRRLRTKVWNNIFRRAGRKLLRVLTGTERSGRGLNQR
jgi:glycosyltransferase involved in cell wall biosynthesis